MKPLTRIRLCLVLTTIIGLSVFSAECFAQTSRRSAPPMQERRAVNPNKHRARRVRPPATADSEGFSLREHTAWLEVNTTSTVPYEVWPDAVGVKEGQTYLEYCDRGILAFRRAFMRDVIVTTNRSQIKTIYGHLAQSWPRESGIRIIGGIKLYKFFDSKTNDESNARDYELSNPAGWLELVDACEEIAQLTNTGACVVESETALTNWHSGKQDHDLAALKAVMAPLNDSPIIYLFNLPSVQATSGRTEDENAAIVEVFAGILGSIFITSYQARPKDLDHEEKQAGRERMFRLLGDRGRMWGKCYTGAKPDGDDEFGLVPGVEHFKTLPERLVIYSGASRWVEDARAAWVEMMRTTRGARLPGD